MTIGIILAGICIIFLMTLVGFYVEKKSQAIRDDIKEGMDRLLNNNKDKKEEKK